MAHAAVGMSSWRSLACDLSGGGVQLSLLARGNVWHLSYRLGESCVLNRGRFTCSVLQASAEFHLLPLSTVQGKMQNSGLFSQEVLVPRSCLLCEAGKCLCGGGRSHPEEAWAGLLGTLEGGGALLSQTRAGQGRWHL
jgi:hypothetical protein